MPRALRSLAPLTALVALLAMLGGEGHERGNTRWPAHAHVIGKDIVWFYGVLWPAMLMSLKLKLPKLL